ncbi:MAG: DNA-processing protein DprA [Proteobacteria bacterium]|nr:DNA-processing protein DprA [Pseudomonadota bacterium]
MEAHSFLDPRRVLALHRLLLHRPGELARALLTGDSSVLQQPVSDDLQRQADEDLKWLGQQGNHLVSVIDADYPERLREIHDPPALLFASGRRSLLSSDHCLAVVGARSASAYGRAQAERIAREVAAQGVTIVSGLALGIDGAAHQGALAAGGDTIAVLGSGCDQVYPRRHWKLAAHIRDQGLLVSEYPPGTLAAPFHFPRRNRILVGICQATLVVEAALKSGSLISAKLAANEGREVMAIPGLVTSRQSHGVHQLIRDGATLVESGTDVLQELGLQGAALEPFAGHGQLTPAARSLLALLESGPLTMDGLLEQSSVPVEELMVDLLTLEVMGLLISDGGRYQLTGTMA